MRKDDYMQNLISDYKKKEPYIAARCLVASRYTWGIRGHPLTRCICIYKCVSCNIVSDVFVNIMNAISALDGKVQDISDNIDKENDDGYSDLIVQISNLQEKIDEKEAQIQELTDEIAVFKEKEEISGNSLSHDSLVKIAKIAKRKKRSISADLVKACRTGRMSAEDAVFFLENTTAEEFDEIVKLYLE